MHQNALNEQSAADLAQWQYVEHGATLLWS